MQITVKKIHNKILKFGKMSYSLVSSFSIPCLDLSLCNIGLPLRATPCTQDVTEETSYKQNR